MKKKIWIMAGVVVLIFVAIGVYSWHSKTKVEDASHACAIDFLKTFVYDVSTSTPQSVIAHTLLAQLLDQYKNVPDCPTLGISDYSITSVGKPTEVKTDFTIPVTFDVLPLSKSQTLWAMASTTWDGSWIRGEHLNLGITNVSTSSVSQSYRLVLP